MATRTKPARTIAVQRPVAGERGMASEVLAARARAQEAEPVRVGAVAANPRNPRETLTEIDELADDMRVQGVLQPLLVCSRAAFLAGQPDLEDQVGDAEWVILAGHRRHAAAVAVGLESVPVYVRDDLAGPDQAARVARTENALRVGLTPLQEARLFGDLRNRGLSERKTADAMGVSPGQVHKRLTLLKLTPTGQQALADDRIDISAALAIADLDDPDVAAGVVGAAARRTGNAWTANDITWQAGYVRRDLQIKRLEQDLTARGIRIRRSYPSRTELEEVRDTDAIAAAEAAGDLHALIDTYGGPTRYYRPRPDGAPAETERRDPVQESWDTATHTRHALIAGVITGPISKADQAFAIGAALRSMSDYPPHGAPTLIRQWTGEAWGPITNQLSHEVDDDHLIAAALAYWLAGQEDALLDTMRWYLRIREVDADDQTPPYDAYFDWLTAHGYTPTDLEQDFRAHTRAAAQTRDACEKPADDADGAGE